MVLILVIRYGWPFLVKQLEDAKAERKAVMEDAKAERKAAMEAAAAERREEIARSMDNMRRRDVMIAEISERTLKALDAMTTEMQGLREEMRNNHK